MSKLRQSDLCKAMVVVKEENITMPRLIRRAPFPHLLWFGHDVIFGIDVPKYNCLHQVPRASQLPPGQFPIRRPYEATIDSTNILQQPIGVRNFFEEVGRTDQPRLCM